MEISWEINVSAGAEPNVSFTYTQDDLLYMWRSLSLGASGLPKKYTLMEACQILLTLWQLALSHGINGHPLIIKQAILLTLANGSVELGGRRIDFDALKSIALEGGLDYQIDAWLSGVPLEYILAE